jgi:hypothetical protein
MPPHGASFVTAEHTPLGPQSESMRHADGAHVLLWNPLPPFCVPQRQAIPGPQSLSSKHSSGPQAPWKQFISAKPPS